MNTYTGPRLLDTAAAVESLPDLPLTENTASDGCRNAARDVDPRTVAPTVAPNLGNRGKSDA